jgi:general secretion pathway protein F
MQFTYKALNANQAVIAGNIEAGDEREALRLIREKNLQVIEIAPQAEDKSALRQKLSSADITVSLFELTTMLDSGVAKRQIPTQSCSAFIAMPPSVCSRAPTWVRHW